MPEDFVTEQTAKMIDVRHPFYFSTAHMPGEPMLRRGNIRRFWAAIVDHLKRERLSSFFRALLTSERKLMQALRIEKRRGVRREN